MNLRDRRQVENRPPDLSGSLQPDGSGRKQNWSDTTEKYRLLLEEQSETIRTQKDTISEQERLIRRQTLDIGKQRKKISELQSSLELGRTNLTEQYESKLSEKDSQILQAQNLAWEWKKKAEKAEQDMSRMEQSCSLQISGLKSEIQSLSDKIVKLNGADVVLQENERLKRQNEELQRSERESREKAEKETAHVKSEYCRKEQELGRLIADAEQEKQKALSLQSVVQKLTDQKAKRLTENNRRQWQIWYQAKKATMQAYVGVLTVICLVTTVLSIIRQKVFCEDVIKFFRGFGKAIQVFAVRIHSIILSLAEVTEDVPNDVAAILLKWIMVVLLWIMPAALIGFGIYMFWEKYGDDIRKGIDAWNCSIAVVVLAGLVHFGDYVKEIVSVNLFGMWLLVDVLLVLAGWYVWGCKKYRGLC